VCFRGTGQFHGPVAVGSKVRSRGGLAFAFRVFPGCGTRPVCGRLLSGKFPCADGASPSGLCWGRGAVVHRRCCGRSRRASGWAVGVGFGALRGRLCDAGLGTTCPHHGGLRMWALPPFVRRSQSLGPFGGPLLRGRTEFRGGGTGRCRLGGGRSRRSSLWRGTRCRRVRLPGFQRQPRAGPRRV